MGGRLAQFGKTQAKKVFLDLALAQKNLGIEMGKLLEITENFTTFEGAAEAARKIKCYVGPEIL